MCVCVLLRAIFVSSMAVLLLLLLYGLVTFHPSMFVLTSVTLVLYVVPVQVIKFTPKISRKL
jgi:hypothetical protein